MKTHKIITTILIISLFITIFSAKSLFAAEENANEEIISANKDFAFKLYEKVMDEDGGKNIFISPSSVAIALAMTYNGAKGETKEAMAKALELEGLSLENVNEANKYLMSCLEKEDEKIEVTIANSLWCRPEANFDTNFIERCKNYYSAEVRNEFRADIINGWIKEKTRGKIDKVIGEIPPEALLYLINAIYFKGTWAVEFDKEKTKEMDFHLLNGQTKKHPMMSQSGKFNYYKGNKFQSVSLPYGNGDMSMYIFLPDKNSGLEEFQSNLNKENWEKWMGEFKKIKGDIILPKFKTEYKITLNQALSALGMGIAFSEGRADFTGMGLADAFISKVIHKTFVEVNEEGTEAAAVTVVEISTTSACIDPPETFYMKVDRPFFFVIKDNSTDTILFMGSIVEPKE